MLRRPDGRLSGDAFIVFASLAEAHRAHRDLNGTRIGDRTVQLDFALKGELYAAVGGAWNVPTDYSARNVVIMRNIPFKATP